MKEVQGHSLLHSQDIHWVTRDHLVDKYKNVKR